MDSTIHSLSGSLPILRLYLPLMKHFLKPLGHCLTTAVMTSTMLRAYALPATEAANPESVPPQPPENSVASASESVEAPVPAEPERVEPAVELTMSVAASPAPLPALDLEATPTASPRVSDLANSTTVMTPVPATAKPEGPRVADLVNPRVLGAVGPTAANPKPAAPEATPAQPEAAQPNKPAAPPNTIAGMRQTLEKRLATIVERDKADREARWQQNLMLSALQAAQMGNFERARQIAQHPALPSEVQIELLAQIAAIESSVAEADANSDPSPKPASASSADAATPATASPGGRNVPPSYSVVNTWESTLPALPGVVLTDRCLPAATPAIATQTPAPTAQSTPTSRPIYPYVPVVGRNVAARLARLSQTAPSTPAAALPIQPVASRPGVPTPTRVSAPEPTSPPAPQSQWNTFFQPLPPSPVNSPAPHSAAQSAATTPATVLPATATQPASQSPLLSATDSPVAAPSVPIAKSPKQPIASPAAHRGLGLDSLVNPVDRLGLALPPSLSAPLEVALGWWAPSEPTTAAPAPSPTTSGPPPMTAPEITARGADATADKAQVLAATVGLTNHPWLRNLEQTLPTWVEPSRDARKTVLPPALPTASTSKDTLQPAAAAMPCNGPSSLSEGSYVVDPAMSKQMGWVNLMFPLPIPAAITSVFGWRVHPIFGDLRFHTGVDIGAPMGTPVMAALEGRVVAADYIGGYGLTVVIENDKVKQRNLYGHLSGIAVRPGMQVTQGSVIGWVGSTGNSTGPHLHFESLMLAEGGWTAVDPLAVAAKQIAQGQ